MKAVKDGIKFNSGTISPMGMCDCYCTIGSGYDANFGGWEGGGCGCGCGPNTVDEFACAAYLAP